MRLICTNCNKKYEKGPEIWIIITLKGSLSIKEIFILCPNCVKTTAEKYLPQEARNLVRE